MGKRIKIAVGALYAFAAIATFGHSAGHQTVCQQNELCSVGRPFFAAFMWPLYWSWEVWS